MNTLVTRLEGLRNGRNTAEFARFVGVKQQTMFNFLNGKRTPNADSIIKICTTCAVASDWLLGINNASLSLGLTATAVSRGAKEKVAALKKSATTVSAKADELLQSIKELEATI